MALKNSAVFLLSLLLSCVAMSGAARILEDTVPSKEEHQPEVPSLPKVELLPFQKCTCHLSLSCPRWSFRRSLRCTCHPSRRCPRWSCRLSRRCTCHPSRSCPRWSCQRSQRCTCHPSRRCRRWSCRRCPRCPLFPASTSRSRRPGHENLPYQHCYFVLPRSYLYLLLCCVDDLVS
ncbi:hypothetical protein ACQJBY_008866 [Aegilops geniculata]